MNKKEARNQLNEILANQKTVSVSRLSKIMDAIDIESMVRINVEQAKRITRQTERLKKLETRGKQ